MPQSITEKPLLLVLLLHDYAARDFLQSGVLDHLAKSFCLSFVITDALKVDIGALGQVVGCHRMSWLRMKRALELTSLLILRWLQFSYTRGPIRYSLGMAPFPILTLGTPLSPEIPYGNMQLGGEILPWRR